MAKIPVDRELPPEVATMMDPALSAAAGAVPPPGMPMPNPAMAGLEMPSNPPPPPYMGPVPGQPGGHQPIPQPPPGVATQATNSPEDDNIQFNQAALIKLKVRRNFQVLRANRPVTFRSFDVWGRGEYLARVKRAVDESDAISQIVTAMQIQYPEQWMFQARQYIAPEAPPANVLDSTASTVRPGLPQHSPAPLS